MLLLSSDADVVEPTITVFKTQLKDHLLPQSYAAEFPLTQNVLFSNMSDI